MTIGFILWDKHWKSSAINLNLFKCTLASIGFVATVGAIDSYEGLRNSTALVMWMMFLSSVIGIFIGDNTWLEALRILGTRRVIIVDSLKPFFGAFLGYIFLEESISDPPMFYSGMVVSVVGVLICALEQTDGEESDTEREEVTGDDSTEEMPSLTWGYALSVLNVGLDAIGFVITKHYGNKLNTFDINLLRFGEASAMLAVWYAIQRQFCTAQGTKKESERRVNKWDEGEEAACCGAWERACIEHLSKKEESTSSRRPLLWGMSQKRVFYCALGVLAVTYICPTLTTYGLFHTPLAMLLTLSSLGPIYSLPLTAWLKNEPITWRAVISSFTAIGGVILVVFGA